MKPYSELIIPQETVNDEQVIIVELLYSTGDFVKMGEPILSFETSKTSIEMEASQDGYIEYLCEDGDEVNVNTIVAKIYDNEIVVNQKIEARENEIAESNTLFSVEAEKLLHEQNLSKNEFSDYDFVTRQLVEEFLDIDNNNGKNNHCEKQTSVIEAKNEEILHIEKISSQKKREIKYLESVQKSSLTSSISVLVKNSELREFASQQLQIMLNSLLPLVVYECSRLLKKYPLLNSYFTCGNIRYYKNINIGIAVEFEDGLKVLTLYNAEKKSIAELEKESFDKINKYLDCNLEVSDLENSTFTISDLSNRGIYNFTPLINKNQSAILGVGSIVNSLSGFIISLTFDHRVLSGKYASEFLSELKERLENYKASLIKEINRTCSICKINLADDNELNGIGLLEIFTNKGQQLICRRCFLGWK